MQSLREAVQSGDMRSVQLAIHSIPGSLPPTDENLLDIIETLPLITERFTERFVDEYKGTQITWYRYESFIWSIGEAMRQILSKNRKLRRNPQLFDAIEEVSMAGAFGKGRESFVMLLGKYGGQDRVPVLRKLLKDAEVSGHAVYSLRLLAAPEAANDILPFLDSPKTWVRNEAKKYYAKIAKLSRE